MDRQSQVADKLSLWNALSEEKSLSLFGLYCVRSFRAPWWELDLGYVITDDAMEALRASLIPGEKSLEAQTLRVMLHSDQEVAIGSRERARQYQRGQGESQDVAHSLSGDSAPGEPGSLQINNALRSQPLLTGSQPLWSGLSIGSNSFPSHYAYTPPGITSLRLLQNSDLFERDSRYVYDTIANPAASSKFFNTQFSSVYGSLSDTSNTPFFNNTSVLMRAEAAAAAPGSARRGARCLTILVIDIQIQDTKLVAATQLQSATRVTAEDVRGSHLYTMLLEVSDTHAESRDVVVPASSIISHMLSTHNYVIASIPANVHQARSCTVTYERVFLRGPFGQQTPQSYMGLRELAASVDPGIVGGDIRNIYSNIQFSVIEDKDPAGSSQLPRSPPPAGSTVLVAVNTSHATNSKVYVVLYNSGSSASHNKYNRDISINYLMVKVPLSQLGLTNRTHPRLRPHQDRVIGFVPLTGMEHEGLQVVGWSTFPYPPPPWKTVQKNFSLESGAGAGAKSIQWACQAEFDRADLDRIRILSSYPRVLRPIRSDLDGVLYIAGEG